MFGNYSVNVLCTNQLGGNDCGAFAIEVSTCLAFGGNPGDLPGWSERKKMHNKMPASRNPFTTKALECSKRAINHCVQSGFMHDNETHVDCLKCGIVFKLVTNLSSIPILKFCAKKLFIYAQIKWLQSIGTDWHQHIINVVVCQNLENTVSALTLENIKYG